MMLLAFLFGTLAFAQQASTEGPENDPDHLAKLSDDVLWRLELDDGDEVRTFRYAGLPASAASGNPLILYGYSFIPKSLDRKHSTPMIVLIHGGVHSNHMTGGPANAATIIRELIQQGYVVVAPEYRGSTGYGSAYAKAIDYGGAVNDDNILAPPSAISARPRLHGGAGAVSGLASG